MNLKNHFLSLHEEYDNFLINNSSVKYAYSSHLETRLILLRLSAGFVAA